MRHVYYYRAITKEIVIFILRSRLGAFFKVLLLIKAEIKSRLWPSSQMTNYGQLARRMASLAGCFLSLHPVPTASAHSLALSRGRADSDPLAHKSLGSIRERQEVHLLSAPRSPTTCALKVFGWRILEQIPAGSHTLPLPVWFRRGSAISERRLPRQQHTNSLGNVPVHHVAAVEFKASSVRRGTR